MPLFEYRCDKCAHRFSLLVGVTAEKAELRCPRCQSKKATKLISRIARIAREDDFDEGGEEFDESGEDFDDLDDD